MADQRNWRASGIGSSLRRHSQTPMGTSCAGCGTSAVTLVAVGDVIQDDGAGLFGDERIAVEHESVGSKIADIVTFLNSYMFRWGLHRSRRTCDPASGAALFQPLVTPHDGFAIVSEIMHPCVQHAIS